MSELCIGRRMASMRESRDSDQFSQHTSTITCTAAPRVWHFSAFHCIKKLLMALLITGACLPHRYSVHNCKLFMALLITGACLPHRYSVHNCNWTGLKTIAVLTLTLLVILVRSMIELSHLEDSTIVLDNKAQQTAL